MLVCDAGVPKRTKNHGKTSTYKDGCRCDECATAIRASNRRYYAKHSVKVKAAARERELRLKYGITPSQLHALKLAQGWRCALCRAQFPRGTGGKLVHVDHCHRTGRVRGVLCSSCNAGLGRFGDSIEGLRRAIAYLEAFEATAVSPSCDSASMTRSTDVVTQPEQPIVDRDPEPQNRLQNSVESPWTREDELQAEALARGR